MRLGFYTPNYPGLNGSGGIALYTQSLALGLVELGHEPHVLVAGDPEELGREHVIDGVPVQVVARRYAPVISRWLRGLRESAEISLAALRLARRRGLDVFEFPNFEGFGSAYRHFGRAAPPLVVRLHTSTAECLAIEGKPLSVGDRFEVWRERHACRGADAIYVSTAAHRRNMAEELGLDEAAIGIVPLGIPDGAAPHLRQPRPRSSPPLVVYVGRLEPRKGVIDLFNAIPTILRALPEARFVLVGADRPLAPGEITHARWLEQNLPTEVRARIELKGFVDDATRQALVEQADVFVAPSLYESFGLIFLEAMRVSVPVVGTTAGGIPEVVEDGVTGLLVPPQAPERIAEAIVTLLRDEPLRLRLAAAGRRRFEERFSNLAMAERTIAHHEALLARWRR